MATYIQLLGSNQSKTAGTSLAITVASLTVTARNTIFVAFSSDDVGSAFSLTDNIGNNTYAQVGTTRTVSSAVKTQLWAATVSVGGTLTSITMSWTTNITAKAMVAGEYKLSGGLRLTDGTAQSSAASIAIGAAANLPFFDGELWVSALGVEDNVAVTVAGVTGDPSQTIVSAGTNGTSGGGSGTNISVTLGHILMAGTWRASGEAQLGGINDGVQNNASAGAIYHGYKLGKRLIINQSVNRSGTY